MRDRGIRDEIDDVITWHGSRDAMTWTAKPPSVPSLRLPEVDPEATRQALGRFAGQFNSLVDAFRPFAEQVARNASAIAEAFSALAADPQVRALMEAHVRGEIAHQSELQACHCFCGVVHGNRMGVCDGEAVAEIVRVSPIVGRVEIPVCRPCQNAQVARAVR